MFIVGRIDGNELYSNGVGKTTIFKAIEYVLFNYSSANLEKVIKEDRA
jgi:DNA repair exonuclease SbcCD ATPase subunit